VVAISVDEPVHSVAWADEKHIPFDLLSDPAEKVIGAFGLINPDRPELSLHAIYIVDGDGKVFYRKVGRRRAYSDELLDALDYRAGTFVRRQKPPAAAP